MFDEVKLVETLRFSGWHVLGYTQNATADGDHEILASHAMVVEVACRFGDPCYILRVLPCKKLTADQLKELLIEAASAVVGAGGTVISLICDNCNINRSVYSRAYLQFLCNAIYVWIYVKFRQLYILASYDIAEASLIVYVLDTKNGQKLPKFTNFSFKYDLLTLKMITAGVQNVAIELAVLKNPYFDPEIVSLSLLEVISAQDSS